MDQEQSMNMAMMAADINHPPVLLVWLAVYLVITTLFFGPLGAMIGRTKGAGWAGFFLGSLLGPLGLLYAFFLKGPLKECPVCKETIRPQAKLCIHCKHTLIWEHGKPVQNN